MPLSWNEIKSKAIEFAKEWEDETSEDAEAKSFWDAFFNIFGITRKRLANFEFEVKKYGGNSGFIDLFWPGVLLVEHKSRGRDLNKAYAQAMDYFPGISEKDLPKYILVSDFEKFRLYDIEENKEIDFNLQDLYKNIQLFSFIAGYEKQEYKEEAEVNIKAAELMGKFYDTISEAGYSGHDLNVFLVRILFCLFADDANIFEKNQFRRYVETRTSVDGSDLGMHISMLFQVLNTPPEKRQSTLDEELTRFEYVDGHLFEETIPVPSFNSAMRQRLLDACAFDWSAISPAIFGSLFQSVMDREARRHLGAHYTSEKNILKLIKPLFLDELQEELNACGKSKQKLIELHNKISNLKFLDPACGCGNFLIISFRELRLLELEILKKQHGTASMLPLNVKDWLKVRPEQFYGIEIDEFPARIAETAVWLMEHQMNELASKMFGKNIKDLPLARGATIYHGNALTKDWNEIVPKEELSYILGNPPFVGSKMMSEEQRQEILSVFGDIKGAGVLDYVSGWYAKAAQYIQNTNVKCAFVSTNSITQGEQVGILWKELLNTYGIIINFAHRTFKWSNEARGKAGVYCVIIGFIAYDTDKKYLYEYEDIKGEPHEIKVKNINPYLVPAENILIEKRGMPICAVPIINYGNMPIDDGNLFLTQEDKDRIINNNPEVEKLIKPFLSAKEFLHGDKKWCLWLINITPGEIKLNKEIFERVEKIRQFRLTSKREATRELALYPSKFGFISQPESDYILIPRVSSENRKYIPMGFFDKNYIVGDTCLSIPNANLYHFGILESEMHMTWVRHVCGRLKSDFRYSNSIVYNNFPWPVNPSEEKIKNVEKMTQNVLDIRAKYPDSSLADLYDPLTMPFDLVKAHKDLDKAVDSAYGKRTFKTDAERMNFLFDLYKKYTDQ